MVVSKSIVKIDSGKKNSKMKSNRDKKLGQKRVAVDRINQLFAQAGQDFDSGRGQILSNRYVALARKLALRYKVAFSKEQKLSFCKKCGSFLVPGVNSRTRVVNGKIIVVCHNCKAIKRMAFK